MGVSIDGTWAKRGHGSQFGVLAAIAQDTGKILDVELMSKFCELCKTYKAKLTKREFDEWFEVHKSKCSINFFEKSSGGMEEAAALVIFVVQLRSKNLGILRCWEMAMSKLLDTSTSINPMAPRLR